MVGLLSNGLMAPCCYLWATEQAVVCEEALSKLSGTARHRDNVVFENTTHLTLATTYISIESIEPNGAVPLIYQSTNCKCTSLSTI